jgi:signal transduction histidine kinase/DNA-binding response OmpR family regulator/ligand-binding sensor domain-containing protein
MTNLIKQLLFTVVIFNCFFLQGQLQLNQISQVKGLSQNTINSIIQDKDGFLWIATYNGINKYDGYSMDYYSLSNSLSSNLIHNLFEDRDGNIWAGTSESGINRINPNTKKIVTFFNNSTRRRDFKNTPYFNPSLHQAASGIFFYYSPEGGYNFFGISDEDVIIDYVKNIRLKSSDSSINLVKPSQSGKHWFFSSGKGIKLSQANITDEAGKIELNLLNSNIIDSIFNDGYVIDFHEYSKNKLYFISNKLELVEIKLNNDLQIISKKEIKIFDNSKDISNIDYNLVNVLNDNKNGFWIGVNDVLINYNVVTGEIFDISYTGNNRLENKKIKRLYVDKFNILWVGTYDSGLFKIDFENKTFLSSSSFLEKEALYNEPFHKMSIKAMCEDNKGNIWLGTEGNGGIAKIKVDHLNHSLSNSKQKKWVFDYLNTNEKLQKKPFTQIKKLLSDSKGNIWVGSNTGLGKIQPLTSNTYKTEVFETIDTLCNPVFAIEEDHLGAIWAGYFGNGLLKLTSNSNTGKYDSRTYKHDPKNAESLSNNIIRVITEDSDKNLWIGTALGLNKLKSNKDGSLVFERFFNKKNDDKSLSNDHVLDIFQSKSGIIYVGTFGGGLNEISLSEDNEYLFKRYTTQEGLPSDVVYQITEDSKGNLWMMHIRGMSRLNLASGEINYFEKSSVMEVDEFRDNSMLKTSSGIIVGGTISGLSFFDPDKMAKNTTKPQLIITDFKISNEPVKVLEKKNGRVILDKNINQTDKIELPFNLNSFEFVFSSIHFSDSEKNQYKHILEGFDKKWQLSTGDERRFASYTNIPPGDYIFKVYGSNSSGIWTDEPKTISISINNPWYFTPPAILIFLVLITTIIYVFVKIRLNQIQLENKLNIKNAVHKKSEELNQMKLQFFTNISHELRTPLTLIVGPLEQIMRGNINLKELTKLNSIMHKNSNRLLKLINQLLDFRKAESGNLNLMVQNDDLVYFVKDIFAAFEEIAFEKKIKFLFLSSEKQILAWFDNDKIEKILYNLLSNAFKFTPKGKSIKINIETENIGDEPHAIIKIIDYGIGIPEEELKSIFERYYQSRNESISYEKGSGLGLAYVKHLVKIHKGEINIKSKLHQGTTCTISLPISKAAYSENSIIELQPQKYDFNYTTVGINVLKEKQLNPNKIVKNDIEHSPETPLILIVEDNKELREYLAAFFSYDFRVLTANNGLEGLELTKTKAPDIIISDLMMPEMSGIEMCKIIKTDINTSHIPVIILTAKIGIENEKEGLETGADEYILKPFDIEILKLRLNNILRTKQQWIQKFKLNSSSKTWRELSNKLDQKFIKKSIEIVQKNMDNTNFSVEQFALDIGMSRSALFLKIKSITRQSSSEFIRTIRINNAAKLIKSRRYSISEIIYMVGFSDPKYFRTCFKKQFGTLPSEYAKKILQKSV